MKKYHLYTDRHKTCKMGRRVDTSSYPKDLQRAYFTLFTLIKTIRLISDLGRKVK